MTEMAHGTIVVQSGEAVLPRWWRTVDRVTIGCVLALFAIGILLGFAASPPLAERNGHEPFHYVIRQFAFGGLALTVMVLVSMMSPTTVRRLGVLGFIAAMGALMLLPVFGTDYGQGAVRWYSLGFASVQPSEFLKPVFVIFTAWMIAASTEIGGTAGQDGVAGRHHHHRGLPRAAAGFRAGGADRLRVVGHLFRRRRADDDPDRRDGAGRHGRGHVRLQQFRAFRPPHRRLPVDRDRPQHAARLTPPTPSARAVSSARGWARGRSSGPCRTPIPTSSSPSPPRNTGLSSSS
jgi:hypothetical protein